jgi:hypothetical protein
VGNFEALENTSRKKVSKRWSTWLSLKKGPGEQGQGNRRLTFHCLPFYACLIYAKIKLKAIIKEAYNIDGDAFIY